MNITRFPRLVKFCDIPRTEKPLEVPISWPKFCEQKDELDKALIFGVEPVSSYVDKIIELYDQYVKSSRCYLGKEYRDEDNL